MSGSHDPGRTASSEGSGRGKPWVWLLALLVVGLLIFGMTRLLVGSDEPEAAGSGSPVSSAPQDLSSEQDEQDEQDEKQGPVQVTRDADGLTVKATVPDETTKTSLLQVIKVRANGANVVDKVKVSDGKRVADFAGLLPLLAAAKDVDDLSVRVQSNKVSVSGATPSQAAKEALSAAAKRAFPDREVTMQVTAPTQAPTSNGSDATAPPPAPSAS